MLGVHVVKPQRLVTAEIAVEPLVGSGGVGMRPVEVERQPRPAGGRPLVVVGAQLRLPKGKVGRNRTEGDRLLVVAIIPARIKRGLFNAGHLGGAWPEADGVEFRAGAAPGQRVAQRHRLGRLRIAWPRAVGKHPRHPLPPAIDQQLLADRARGHAHQKHRHPPRRRPVRRADHGKVGTWLVGHEVARVVEAVLRVVRGRLVARYQQRLLGPGLRQIIGPETVGRLDDERASQPLDERLHGVGQLAHDPAHGEHVGIKIEDVHGWPGTGRTAAGSPGMPVLGPSLRHERERENAPLKNSLQKNRFYSDGGRPAVDWPFRRRIGWRGGRGEAITVEVAAPNMDVSA